MIGVFEFPGGARRSCIIVTVAEDALRPGKGSGVWAHVVLVPGDMLEMAVGKLPSNRVAINSDGLFVSDPVAGVDGVYRIA